MKSIETKEREINISLERDDEFLDIKRILNHVTFTKYEAVSFETNDVKTSVIHKLREMFTRILRYKETSNPYDNSEIKFEK